MKKRKRRHFSVLYVVGFLFIAAAVILTMNNLNEQETAAEASEQVMTMLQEKKAATVKQRPDGVVNVNVQPVATPIPDYIIDPTREMPVQNINGNDYIGVLSMPTIDIELPVMNEWSYPKLKVAPCRYCGTAYLENFVICAHNYDRHFGRINTLHQGDKIIFTDMAENVFEYEVSSIEILRPYQVSEMKNSGFDLTLFTCTIGGATRVTVRCTKL